MVKRWDVKTISLRQRNYSYLSVLGEKASLSTIIYNLQGASFARWERFTRMWDLLEQAIDLAQRWHWPERVLKKRIFGRWIFDVLTRRKPV